MTWVNYFVNSKHSRLTEGHLNSDDLKDKILNHDGSTAYCCYFDLRREHLKHESFEGEYDSDGKKLYAYYDSPKENTEITFSKYDQAPARPALGLISFDFDAEDPQDAFDDVKLFIDFLEVKSYHLFFSGSKGFHLMIPESFFGLEHTLDLPYVLRDFSKYLKETFETLDTSIYNYNRKFRVPFTRHEKTGLYKNEIDPQEHDTIEKIKKSCNFPIPFDFTSNLDHNQVPSEKVLNLLEASRKKSYLSNVNEGGTKNDPTPFERFDGKKCIEKMLEKRCDDIGRNNAAMRIVNDFYRTGKTRDACEQAMATWAAGSGLPLAEVSSIITNVYERGADYNFGCQDDCKSAYCSYQCPLYLKLDPDKRPEVLDMPTSAAEKLKKPKEHEVIKSVLEGMFHCTYDELKNEYLPDGDLIKQDNDLFYYRKGRWDLLSQRELDLLKTRIYKQYKNYGTYRAVENTYKALMTYCPSVPESVNLFIPNPYCANFLNGSLHLLEDQEGMYYLEFKEHNKLDYLSYQIPMDFDESKEVSKALLELLDTIFEGDLDKEDKIYAIAEMFGAALMANFPRMFYLWGESGSGKSTLMKILRLMLGDTKNICSVQPKDFHGFNMETMAGKLVNMVTDVDYRTPIKDDIVKQIEDRVEFRIARKFKTDLRAPLPAVHIFGGNRLIKSQEGECETFERRWSLVKFNRKFTGKKQRNIDSIVFNKDPEGVLAFAIMGLKRIIEKQGYFTTFKASNEDLKQWSMESDFIGQFLDECFNGDGEVSLVKHENAKIKRATLWAMFKDWQDEALVMRDRIGKFSFFEAMSNKKFKVKILNGYRYFSGLGELIDESACVDLDDVSDEF